MSEWFGILPERWSLTRNKYIFSEINNKTTADNGELLSVSQYTGVTLRRKSNNKIGMYDAESLIGYKIVEKNNLVMNIMLAWNGSLGVSKYNGIASPAYAVYSVNNKHNPWYFHYLFRTKYSTSYFKMYSTGVVESRLRLYPDTFSLLKSPLPPRTEQDQIVRFLDWKVSQTNRLINAKKKQVLLLQEQKRAMINAAVTKGGEGWEKRYISQVCSEQKIKNTGNVENNILSLSYGQIIQKKNMNSALSPVDYETWQIVDEGNIVLRLTDLQNDHTSLRTGLVRERGVVTSAYTCLKAWDFPEFLHLALHSLDVKKVFYGLGGGVRQSIGYKDIRYIEMAYPPLNVQRAIVAELNKKCVAIDRLIEKLDSEISLLHEYRTRLISDVVTGKMDVRDVEVPQYEVVEEPAEDELLDENEEGMEGEEE